MPCDVPPLPQQHFAPQRVLETMDLGSNGLSPGTKQRGAHVPPADAIGASDAWRAPPTVESGAAASRHAGLRDKPPLLPSYVRPCLKRASKGGEDVAKRARRDACGGGGGSSRGSDCATGSSARAPASSRVSGFSAFGGDRGGSCGSAFGGDRTLTCEAHERVRLSDCGAGRSSGCSSDSGYAGPMSPSGPWRRRAPLAQLPGNLVPPHSGRGVQPALAVTLVVPDGASQESDEDAGAGAEHAPDCMDVDDAVAAMQGLQTSEAAALHAPMRPAQPMLACGGGSAASIQAWVRLSVQLL